VAEVGLRLSGWAPPDRDTWSRLHGVISIEHFYPQYTDHFARLETAAGEAICGPAPEHTLHGDSERDAMQPDRFLCEKPAGTRRVVLLGGSSVQGFMLQDAQTIPSRLEVRLRARGGGTVEVINAGVAGYNTLQIRRMMPEVWDLSPDVLVLYAGHNDYAYYPAVEAALRASPVLRTTRSTGDNIALWRWMRELLRSAGALPPIPTRAAPTGGNAARAVFQVAPLAVPSSRSARQELVAQQEHAEENVSAFFAENVTWLKESAASRGVELVLVTPVSRADWRPSGSMHWRDLSDEDLARFESGWSEISRRWETRGENEDPNREAELKLADLAPLLALDDTFSDLLFLAGRASLREGNVQQAISFYRQAEARQPPTRSDRAPHRHGDRLVTLGESLGVQVVDIRPLVTSSARVPGLPGEGIFLDGLHLTPLGADLVAGAIAEAL
jgi:lysophospholipase L1-like esterase